MIAAISSFQANAWTYDQTNVIVISMRFIDAPVQLDKIISAAK